MLLLAFWAIVAWINWPWPEYGYCDFWPPPSWDLVAFDLPMFAFLLSILALPVAIYRAAKRGNRIGLYATFASIVLWWLIGHFIFDPHAVPGDGCYDDSFDSPSNNSLERSRER